MAQTILLKRRTADATAPVANDLATGEVAVNAYTGKLYIKKTDGTVAEVSGSGGGGDGGLITSATFVRYEYTATNNQTTFTGNDNGSQSLVYVVGNILVYLNGVLLDDTVDYVATNTTSVVLQDGATTNDLLTIISYNKNIGTGNTTVNTFSGNGSTTAFTLSEDPSGENNTRVYIDGIYQSKSNYSVSTTTLTFSTAPPSGTGIEVEIGNREVATSGITEMTISGDLTVDTNTLFVDSTNNKVGIKTLTPSTELQVVGTVTATTFVGALTGNVTGNVSGTAGSATGNAATATALATARNISGISFDGSANITLNTSGITENTNLYYTDTRVASYLSTNSYATQSWTTTQINNLIDSAPGALNTLNELAAALGDDASFSTTVTNSLALKVGLTAATGAATLPTGTTGQRPGSPAAGQFRYNSTLGKFEGYTDAWGEIGGTLSALTVSGAANLTLTTAAQTNITSLGTLTGLTSSDTLTVDAADGTADNDYVGFFRNQEGTDDRNFGVRIIAGKTASDKALSIDNQRAGGGDALTFTGDGKLGIGTATPGRALSTKSSSVTVGSFESTSASGGMIGFVDSNTTNDVTVRAGALGNDLVLQAGGSTRMTITSSGYIHMAGAADVRLTLGSQGTAGNNDSNWIRGNGTSLSYNSASGNHLWEVGGTEKMRIDNSGKVGIGVTPSGSWDVNIDALQIGEQSMLWSGDTDYTDATWVGTNVYQTGGATKYLTTGVASVYGMQNGQHYWYSYASGSADATVSGNEVMNINASGNVTIAGTITSNTLNSVSGNDLRLNAGSANRDVFFQVNGSTIATIKGSTSGFYLGTTASRVTSGVTPNFVIEGTSYNTNSIGVFTNANGVLDCPAMFFGKSRGTSVGSNTIVQNGDRLFTMRIDGSDGTNLEQAALIEAYVDAAPANNSVPGRLSFWTTNDGSQYATEKMRINNAGNVTIAGALSKGSGSFKIDHPLESKKDTHHLVHSFIEGPQADLIYRGTVDLVDGSATVNLDSSSGMTDGTFVLLNTNVQCFTSNESGWTAIKGSVSGNVLTITSQESCTDTISWMVVGERHDKHMKDTDWTDADGKVIVEPEKKIEPEGA